MGDAEQAELYTREATTIMMAAEAMHLGVPREKNKKGGWIVAPFCQSRKRNRLE
jgi:hypothetical protein